MKNKLGVILILLIVIFAGIGIYFLFFKSPEKEFKTSLETMTKDYYQKIFYPANQEDMWKHKDTGYQISLQTLKNSGYDISKFEEEACSLKETYGVIRFGEISNEDKFDYNYEKNFTVSTIMKCKFTKSVK